MERLSYEIVFLVLHHLHADDLRAFLSTCKRFYQLQHDSVLWRSLVRNKYGVRYRDPAMSWFDMATSAKEVLRMCPHLTLPWEHDYERVARAMTAYTSPITHENVTCCPASGSSSFGMCLSPGCYHLACGDIFFHPQKNPGHLHQHYLANKTHAIVLRLIGANFLELWCYACDRPVGFWGTEHQEHQSLPVSEQYGVRQWLRWLTYGLDFPQRRACELKLLYSTIQTPSLLLDSQWFYRWIHYLSNAQAVPPSTAPRHDRFFAPVSRQLLPHLKFHTHFVVVSVPLYCYVKRMYNIHGPTVHKDCLDRGVLSQINRILSQ
ncbi:hypothetical protein BC940DRAFT_335024 [Gongronella butleri]|nr:hypothetical protein BC940DRAFT_335024 [Gongronella butleri]